MLKKILPLALWLTATVAAFGQNAVMVNRSNSIITYPSNFWTANALMGRTGLGFNTNLNAFWAATNAATARTAIGALATNGNGSALTNLTASNITGTLAISNGGSGATTAGGARTNLGLGVTNSVTFSNISATGYISMGISVPLLKSEAAGSVGFYNGVIEEYILNMPSDTDDVIINAQWNNAGVRSNLGLGLSALTNTTAANFRTAIGALATNGDGSGLTNLPASSFSGTLAISNGGSGATTAGGARTNFGLGWSALTNPQSSLYSGTATKLLGYMPEIIAGGTNPSGFNVLAYTNTEGLVIPANLMIGEDLAPAPRNLRHVEIRGTATIGNPYTDDTILGANYASVTDQVNFTNTIATWSSNALTMEMPIAFSTNTAAATTRANLGLGTAATNPASAFQPSSSVLTNLANNNGSSLTNLSAAGIVGILATNGNGAGLTNLTAANITGAIAISNGGSGATTAGGARTNLGLGATNDVEFQTVKINLSTGAGNSLIVTNSLSSATSLFDDITVNELDAETAAFGNTVIVSSNGISFNTNTAAATTRTNLGIPLAALTNTNTTNFRTAIGLGTASTVNFGSLQLDGSGTLGIGGMDLTAPDSGLDLAFKRIGATNMVLKTNGLVLHVGSYSFSSSNTTGAAITRTNLGLGATNTVFFNTVSVKEKGLGTLFNGIQWQSMYPSSNGLIQLYGSDSEGTTTFGINIGTMSGATTEVALFNANRITFYEALEFNNTTNAATTRTNLRLGWSALTNTNTAGFNTSLYGSGTNPVLYNTNGEVVSPTNFWQVAPIVTRFVESQPVVSQTTNITAARNLHIHSLAISTTGVTNTIALPTTNSLNGDIALVVHQGPTSSVTAIRTADAATNLITLNRFEEAVEFVYYNNVWQFNHNPSFTEPIYFSGTNGAGHAAESRTNLGIPLAALTNTNNANFQAAVFQTNAAPVSGASFGAHAAWMEVNVITNGSNVSFRIPLYK